VLAEMIWAFEQKVRDDDESEFFDHSECGDVNDFIKNPTEHLSKSRVDWAGLKQHQERKQNGFRLFGKYYQNLWD
jgi:cytochrome c2